MKQLDEMASNGVDYCGTLGKADNDKIDKGVDVKEFILVLFEKEKFGSRFKTAAEDRTISFLEERGVPQVFARYKMFVCRARDLRARARAN